MRSYLILMSIVLFSLTGWVSMQENNLIPYWSSEGDLWSKETQDVNMLLVGTNVEDIQISVPRAFVFRVLEIKNEKTDLRPGVTPRLRNVSLAISFPKMQPWSLVNSEFQKSGSAIDNQLILIISRGASILKRWNSLFRSVNISEKMISSERLGMHANGNFHGLEKYEEYISGIKRPSQILLKSPSPDFFYFVECLDETVGLCSTYVDVFDTIQIKIQSRNIFIVDNVLKHEATIKAAIEFVKSHIKT